MDEIEAMQSIAENLEKLPEDAQERVLLWANSKFGLKSQIGNVTTTRKSNQGKRAKATGKKASTVISIDKSLNLSPPGEVSATDFMIGKAPGNTKEKCVVAAYYLRETISLSKVSVSAIYTYFKAVSWKLPADLRNTLAQAGSEGWLDTADSEDIKITPMGENLVEHDLPKKKN